jgi:hypothetical protein
MGVSGQETVEVPGNPALLPSNLRSAAHVVEQRGSLLAWPNYPSCPLIIQDPCMPSSLCTPTRGLVGGEVRGGVEPVLGPFYP